MDADKKAHLKEKAAEELRLLVLITAYLAAVFAAFLTYRRIVSREFGVTAFHYGYALLEALLIAKVILIGKAIGLGRKGTRRTLAWSVLRSSLAYGGLVAVFAILEHVIEGLLHGKTLAASLDAFVHQGACDAFSGEQIQPWLCTTDSNGLGPAQDAQCNAPTTYEYFYMPTTGAGFQPYDPASPPADVATTTTDQGNTVPYIIRQETGTQNRGIYRIAVLFDPTKNWEPWAAQAGWNHKLFYPYGASCGTIHSQSDAQDVQNDFALSRGFMVATSSMNVLGNNCNDVTSAESVLMLKERIVDRYGEIRYTMANGCSGGSIGQHMTNNAYPGLVQGIQPNCSYEDNTTTGVEVEDCHLLFRYFTLTSPQLWALEAQKAAVAGEETFAPCELWEALSEGEDPTDVRGRHSE